MTTLTETPHAGEFLVSEANGTLSREVVTIASGSGVVPAGLVLGKITASGKYKPYDDDNADGSETAVCLAYDTVDATSADKKAVVIFRNAEVRASAILWAATNDATDKANGLADLVAKNIIAR